MVQLHPKKSMWIFTLSATCHLLDTKDTLERRWAADLKISAILSRNHPIFPIFSQRSRNSYYGVLLTIHDNDGQGGMVPYDSDRRYVGRELAGRRQDEEGEDDRDDCSLCSDAFDIIIGWAAVHSKSLLIEILLRILYRSTFICPRRCINIIELQS